jgi:hypothetical protein
MGTSQTARNQYGKSHEKARPNFAKTTQQAIENQGWEALHRPAYSSDLVPVDATLLQRENFKKLKVPKKRLLTILLLNRSAFSRWVSNYYDER